MEYVETIKENRTGVTRYNQGMQSETLNKTASGIKMIQSAAQQRLELMARVLAEGLKDFYYKCARLYQIYQRQPFAGKVKGKDVQVSPEQLQGKIRCKVSMSVEAEVGIVENAKVREVFAFLAQMNQVFPGALGVEQAHNLMTRFITSMGFHADEFVIPLDKWAEILEAQNQQQKEMVELQKQMAQSQEAREGDKLRLEAAKAQGQLDSEDRKLSLQEQIAELNARLKLLGTMKDERPQVVI